VDLVGRHNVRKKHGVQNMETIFLSETLLYKRPGGAVAEAVSGRPLTSEARVRIPVSQCEICGGQSETVTGFSRV
jgi:hypothetical protein